MIPHSFIPLEPQGMESLGGQKHPKGTPQFWNESSNTHGEVGVLMKQRLVSTLMSKDSISFSQQHHLDGEQSFKYSNICPERQTQYVLLKLGFSS